MSFRLATTPLLLSRLLPASVTRTNSTSFLVPAAASLLQKASFLPATSSSSASASASKKTFSTTSSNMASTELSLSEAISHRRTIYQLTKESTISDDRLKEIVSQAILDVPSSFNSQSTRLIVLVKEKHDQYWQIVEDALRAIVPADSWASTEGRIKMCKNAYGTILFYEDREVVKGLQTKLPIYADKFPQWADHTSAMHQYALWVALEVEGLGANLQHYNPLPDQKVSEQFGVPLEWSHVAQLVFGKPAEGAREGLQKKDQKPVEERVQYHGF